MTGSSTDPHRLLAGLHRDNVELSLNTLDICFLAALHLRAQQSALASFDEELVLDVFEQVCDLVEPGAENARKRATSTIQRLRTQRLLARVDATGIVSAGEYALTGLASVIIKSFLEDEQLTRESLSLLTGAVISSLGPVRTAAHRALDEATWRADVVGPLRVTVSDLVGGIERRQRGLDAQQEEVRQQIGELLKTDWFGAVEQCQLLLEKMAGTLQELNLVLLRDSSQIHALLQEVQQAAASALAADAELAAQRVAEQVDRMVAWGASRQHAWSGYYQYVHRFLRDVVRLDPDRALSQRLLEQIRGWPQSPFALVAAFDGRIRVLRSVSLREERSPVGRPREDRESALADDLPAQGDVDLLALVSAVLERGAPDLAHVTREVLNDVRESDRYRATGQIAEIVARLRLPRPLRERPWVGVTAQVEIEDWSIDPLPKRDNG